MIDYVKVIKAEEADDEMHEEMKEVFKVAEGIRKFLRRKKVRLNIAGSAMIHVIVDMIMEHPDAFDKKDFARFTANAIVESINGLVDEGRTSNRMELN